MVFYRPIKLFYVVAFFIASFPLFGQINKDPEAQNIVQQAIEKTYNFEFDAAEQLTAKLKPKYGQHPVVPLLKAMRLQWQFLPMAANAPVLKQYQETLNACIINAKKLLQNPQTKPEGIFFLLAAHGYIALAHNYNKETLKAAGEGRKAYGYLTDSFGFLEQYDEFLFTTGMYNYYIEQYPEDHPMVRPIMFFFKNGDKALGLKQLELALKKGTFTRWEACSFMRHIFIKHETCFDKAQYYAKISADKFPDNPVYLMQYIEALALDTRLNEAAALQIKFKKYANGFYASGWHLFEAIIEEKRDKDDVSAAENYQLVLKYPIVETFTREYHALAYAGLARIAARKNEPKKAKMYYQKCLALAEYESTIKGAKLSL